MSPTDLALIIQSIAIIVLTGTVLFIATVCFRGLASVDRRLTRIETLEEPAKDDLSR